jgi:AcrR family transcriptional regulator
LGGGLNLREVKEAEVRKTEIISAAKYLFNTKGYEKTTTQDIVDSLKISRGLLYYHFKSKEDILYYIVERQVKTKLVKFRGITYDETLGAKEKLIQFLDNSVNSEPPDDPVDYKLNDIVHSSENTLMMDRICHQLAYALYDYFSIILKQGSEGWASYFLYETGKGQTLEEAMLDYSNKINKRTQSSLDIHKSGDKWYVDYGYELCFVELRSSEYMECKNIKIVYE